MNRRLLNILFLIDIICKDVKTAKRLFSFLERASIENNTLEWVGVEVYVYSPTLIPNKPIGPLKEVIRGVVKRYQRMFEMDFHIGIECNIPRHAKLVHKNLSTFIKTKKLKGVKLSTIKEQTQ